MIYQQVDLKMSVIKSLSDTFKTDLLSEISDIADDLLVCVTADFVGNEIECVSTHSPITIEDYQKGGYINIYRKASDLRGALS